MLDVVCAGCGRAMRAPESMAGKMAKCPGCKAPVRVPSPMDDIAIEDEPDGAAGGPVPAPQAPAATRATAPEPASAPDRREKADVVAVTARVVLLCAVVLAPAAAYMGDVRAAVMNGRIAQDQIADESQGRRPDPRLERERDQIAREQIAAGQTAWIVWTIAVAGLACSSWRPR